VSASCHSRLAQFRLHVPHFAYQAPLLESHLTFPSPVSRTTQFSQGPHLGFEKSLKESWPRTCLETSPQYPNFDSSISNTLIIQCLSIWIGLQTFVLLVTSKRMATFIAQKPVVSPSTKKLPRAPALPRPLRSLLAVLGHGLLHGQPIMASLWSLPTTSAKLNPMAPRPRPEPQTSSSSQGPDHLRRPSVQEQS
jgi:hypothetical protein